MPGVEASGAAKEDFGFVRKENLGEVQPKRDRKRERVALAALCACESEV